MLNIKTKNGNIYKADKSLISGKYVLDSEDFIKEYKDSDDEFIQCIINGLVDDYLSNIIDIMLDYASAIDILNKENNKEFSDKAFQYYQNLSYYYKSYNAGIDKIWWDCIEGNIEYWWEKEILSIKGYEYLPDLKTVLSYDYISNIISINNCNWV